MLKNYTIKNTKPLSYFDGYRVVTIEKKDGAISLSEAIKIASDIGELAIYIKNENVNH